MRYLETYKIFELNRNDLRSLLSDEISWIKESLLNLSDADCLITIKPFNVRVDWKNSEDVPGLIINIKSDRLGKMIPIEVGDNLLTIDSYLKEEGWQGYNTYKYNNIYSPTRYQVDVTASLRDIENKYERELSEFVKMLDRFTMNAPFDEIEVKYFKPPTTKDWVLNESIDFSKEIIEDFLRDFSDIDIPVDVELQESKSHFTGEVTGKKVSILIGDEDTFDSILPLYQNIDNLTALDDYLTSENYKLISITVWIKDADVEEKWLIKPISIGFYDFIKKIKEIESENLKNKSSKYPRTFTLVDIWYELVPNLDNINI